MQLLKIFFLTLLSLTAFAQNNVNPVKVGARALNIEGENILAVTFENDDHWHTYWKNPGDAGTEIKIEFQEAGNNISLTELPWPKPKRYIEQGNLWAYGYSHKYSLFFKLPESLKNKTLDINSQWLVCKDICIPGGRIFAIDLDENLNGTATPVIADDKLKSELAKLPKLGDVKFEFFLNKNIEENKLSLHYLIENADFKLISDKESVIYPYHQFPFDYKHEELYFDKENKLIYGRIQIDWDGVYEEPPIDLPQNGVFDQPITAKFLVNYGAEPVIIEKTFKEFSLTGEEALNKIFAKLNTSSNKTTRGANKKDQSLFWILIFGFLGGLILNLMPCVLPVISLKLFGLVAHRDEGKKNILRHNLAYTAGVLSSFFVLGAVIISIKETGAKIGWGFQLQSPIFVFFMLMFIFILALNMLGLFEFVTPGGRTLGNKELKSGFMGDFVNGIIAVILSTPCSAPFLGSALTYAFTTETINIFIVFTAIGLGLAFPFIITGIFPALIKFLPKPGAWMEKLKNFLGLTLLLTVVWLYDVLDGLIDLEFSGIYINAILVMTFFAFFLRKKISRNPFLSLAFFVMPVLLFAQTVKMGGFDISQTETKSSSSLAWQKWSKEKLDSQPGPIFVNFTAKWCLTCKVNKKLVLETDDFKQFSQEYKISLLEGDWTKRDPEISAFLESHSIVGVPAYFVKTKSGQIKSLGETISIEKIREALK